MVLSMRLYVCWAAGLICIVCSVGEIQDKSTTAPLLGRIGSTVMRALDTCFAALMTMGTEHVEEAYEIARQSLKDMDTD